jgi:hypothetical protein
VEYTVDADADGVAVKEDVAEANNEDDALADSGAAIDVELLADAVAVALPVLGGLVGANDGETEEVYVAVKVGDEQVEGDALADQPSDMVAVTEFDALVDAVYDAVLEDEVVVD